MPEITSPADIERAFKDHQDQLTALKTADVDQMRRMEESFKATLSEITAIQRMGNRPATPEDRSLAESVMSSERHARDIEQIRTIPGARNDIAGLGVNASGDKKELIALQTVRLPNRTIPGLLDNPNPTPWQRELQVVGTLRALFRAGKSERQLKEGCSPKLDTMLMDKLLDCPNDAIRAYFQNEGSRIFADISGSGAETIFDYNMPEIERKIDLGRGIMSIFDVRPVSANTVNMPYQTKRIRPYKAGVAAGNDPPRFTQASPGTANRPYVLTKMALSTQLDDDASEDSFLDASGWLMENIAGSAIEGEEDAAINGSEAASHHDTALNSWDPRGHWGADNAGALDHRCLWTGLRARAIAATNTTDRSSTAILTAMRTARGTLKAPYGTLRPVHIGSYETFVKHLQSAEDFKTIDKYGAMLATLINGTIPPMSSGLLPNEVGRLDNVPIVLSWFITADLNATGGVYTGSGTTTGMITTTRDRFQLLQRRERRIEIEREARRGVSNIVLTARSLFCQKPGDNATTDKLAHWLYNITG